MGNCDVWGLGHPNYEDTPNFDSYDLIINLENYNYTDWMPNLSGVTAIKFLWAVDAHSHPDGIDHFDKIYEEGQYDLVLQATKKYCDDKSVWLPNCYDDNLIKPKNIPIKADVGFCGNNHTTERKRITAELAKRYDFVHENVYKEKMVDAINSYKIHFNNAVSTDINYRCFETMGCETALITSWNDQHHALGFVDGYNCMVYANDKELFEKIDLLLSNNKARKAIAHNGYSLAKKHTYKKRCDYIKQLYRRRKMLL
jgi:spore maturation protein CgeB